MGKIFNHLKTNKTKYIVGVVLIVVFSLSFYVLSKQENKFEKLSRSVLMLNSYDTKNQLLATGSGFVIFENDILVTNYRLIEKAYKIEAVDEENLVYSLDKVVAFDEEKDLAILKFSSPTNLKALKLHSSSKVSRGDDVIAIGSPIGLKNTISKGIISSIRKDKDLEFLQVTATNLGSSDGGALLNEKGKVIGITFIGIEDGQRLDFAIPSNEVSMLYEKRLKEITVQDFFFKRYPDEKYKLSCIKISFNDLLSGKYYGKNICVSGWVPRLMDNEYIIGIIGNKNKINYYASGMEDNDLNRNLLFMGVEFEEKCKDVRWVSTDRIHNVKAGDFITVYGKADSILIQDSIVEIN